MTADDHGHDRKFQSVHIVLLRSSYHTLKTACRLLAFRQAIPEGGPIPYVDEHAAEFLFLHMAIRLLQEEGLLSDERTQLLLPGCRALAAVS